MERVTISPMEFTRARFTAIAGAALAGAAFWRGWLAVQHYRTSLTIIDDPSMRELEQVSAFVESGVALVLLAHAVAAAYLVRRPVRLHVTFLLAIAGVTGTLVVASFLRAPIAGAPGVLSVSLLLAAIGGGYRINSPWASAYLGAALGSVVGACVSVPGVDAMVALAVAAPQVIWAMAGVALGSMLSRRRPVPASG